MAAGAIYQAGHVSGLIHNGYAGLVTDQPETAGPDPKIQFARVVRDARERRGLNQDELADKAGVSRPTIQRIETAKTGTPNPDTARRIFQALGLDPRLIPVILGYATADEMGLPPEMPRVFTPTIERAIAILEDPNVPAATKAEWVEFLAFRAGQTSTDAPRKAG